MNAKLLIIVAYTSLFAVSPPFATTITFESGTLDTTDKYYTEDGMVVRSYPLGSMVETVGLVRLPGGGLYNNGDYYIFYLADGNNFTLNQIVFSGNPIGAGPTGPTGDPANGDPNIGFDVGGDGRAVDFPSDWSNLTNIRWCGYCVCGAEHNTMLNLTFNEISSTPLPCHATAACIGRDVLCMTFRTTTSRSAEIDLYQGSSV